MQPEVAEAVDGHRGEAHQRSECQPAGRLCLEAAHRTQAEPEDKDDGQYARDQLGQAPLDEHLHVVVVGMFDDDIVVRGIGAMQHVRELVRPATRPPQGEVARHPEGAGPVHGTLIPEDLAAPERGQASGDQVVAAPADERQRDRRDQEQRPLQHRPLGSGDPDRQAEYHTAQERQ
jgi:hypothetical protein